MSLSIATSGMNISQYQMNSNSHNIANANTENFHAEQTLSKETASTDNNGNGATVSTVRRSSETGVNLSSELADMKQNETVYKANAKVVQAQNNAFGSILDVKA